MRVVGSLRQLKRAVRDGWAGQTWPGRFLAPWVRHLPYVKQKAHHYFSNSVPMTDSVVQQRLPNGLRLKLYQHSTNAIGRQIAWTNGYEPETTRFFFERCRDARVVIDIGSNVGYYGILAALSNVQVRAYAFEPLKIYYDQMVKNIALNQLENRVQPLCQAVSSQTGMTTLFVPKKSELSEASILKGFRTDVEDVLCPSISLDQFAADRHLHEIDIVKIDVEGAEHLVFEGMREILSHQKPGIICEVLPGRFRDETRRLLKDFGYSFTWISPEGLKPTERLLGDKNYRCLNYYFSAKK